MSDSDIIIQEANEDNIQPSKCSKKSNTKSKSSGDFIGLMIDGFSSISWKKYIILFLLLIIFYSDIFIEKVISKISDSVEGTNLTTKGVVMTAMFATIAYMLISILVDMECL